MLDWSIVFIGIFGIIGAAGATLFSWLGGKFDSSYGPMPVIKTCVIALILVCVTIVFMSRESIYGIPLPEGSIIPDATFFICGVLIGGFGGALQGASRNLMSRHADPNVPTEYFGLYGLSGRATAFLAPTLIGTVTFVTESPRLGVSPLVLLFIIGFVLLRWVDPNGRRI